MFLLTHGLFCSSDFDGMTQSLASLDIEETADIPPSEDKLDTGERTIDNGAICLHERKSVSNGEIK